MSASQRCSDCGAEFHPSAPSEWCPTCLLHLGLEADSPVALSETADLEPLLAKPHTADSIQFHRLGDYELLEEIGRGGMGVVFRARQMSLNRTVALKLILAGRLASPALVKRFQVEAAAAARLRHPHIVAIFEIGQRDGHNFYSMELVDGEEPDRQLTRFHLPRAGTVPSPDRAAIRDAHRRIARLMALVTRAVEFAHQHGVLHRDLKPSNLLIDRDGHPRLADFGLAKLVEQDAGLSQLTGDGAIVGTPGYMAPEQAAGCTNLVTTAADIYSLGAILYELLTGRPPFAGAAPGEHWRRLQEEEPNHPCAVNALADGDLATISLKCLEKEPSRRYGSAAALAEDLEQWVEGEPISARPVGQGERVWRWARRRPALSALALLTAVSLIAGLVGVSTQWRRAENQRHRAESEGRIARLNLYAADMGLAQQAIREGNLGWARELLDAHRPGPGSEDLRHFEWRLNRHLAQGEHSRVINAHDDVIRWLTYSHDGQWIATASSDFTVKIWRYDGFQPVATLSGHTGAVNCVAFSRDDRLAATTSEDGWLKLWDTATWTVTWQARTKPRHVAFSPVESILAVSEGGNARSSIGRVILSDYEQNKLMRRLNDSGNRFAFGADGKTIVTGGDGPVIAWETATGRGLWTNQSKSMAMSIATSPDGKRFAKGSIGGGVYLFDFDRPDRVAQMSGPMSRVWSVAFSPQGSLLAAGSSDQNTYLWDAAASERSPPLRTLKGQGTEVRTVAFSLDGHSLITGDKAGKIFLWDLRAQRREPAITNVFTIYSNPPPVFSRRGDRVAAWSRPNEVSVWNLATLERVQSFRDTLAPLAFSEDGASLKALGSEGAFKVWDVASGQLRRVTAPVRTKELHVCALAPDGRTLAIGGFDGRISLWDAESESELWLCAAHTASIRELKFSRDGRFLASASWDFTAKLWEVAGRKEMATLRGHREGVFALDFSPDGTVLATGSIDGTARVWGVPTGRLISTLAGHKEGVFRAAFTPDGETLATASDDRTVRLWNCATWREVGRIDHRSGVITVGFTPDGETMVTTSLNGMLNIWRAPSFQAIDAAQRRVGLHE